VGVPGYWLVGDSTWPGLGTVACCLGSRLVAEGVLAGAIRRAPAPRPTTARVRGAAHAVRDARGHS
jgi:hypothetical protein